MRVISWNMGAAFGYNAERHERAWHFLRALDPDIALLQEAVPPPWAPDYWSMETCRKYPANPRHADVPWGSAVLAKSDPIERFVPSAAEPWLTEFGGSAVVTHLGGTNPLWLASIHSNATSLPTERIAALNRPDVRRCDDVTLWEIELIAHELESVFGEDPFIIGGDLNASLSLDRRYGHHFGKLFANLGDAGFIDLRTTVDEQPTFFQSGRHEIQIDHIYADRATATPEHSWRVLVETARDLHLSDHAPIEISWPPHRTVETLDSVKIVT